MKGIFVDSDVILDVMLEREPFRENAILAIEKCLDQKLGLYFTSVIIANIYFVARKWYPDKVVRQKIKELLTHIDIINTDKNCVFLALDSNFTDFEDALQNYSAVASRKIDTIITRNIKHYKHSQLAVMTPELFLKSVF